MIIKIILSLSFIVVVLYLIRVQNSAKIRAWRKIAMFLFATFAIFSILYPNITNDAATAVGVGRGADLLLYLVAVAFVFLGLHSYVKFRELNHSIAQLTRKIAILEAKQEIAKK